MVYGNEATLFMLDHSGWLPVSRAATGAQHRQRQLQRVNTGDSHFLYLVAHPSVPFACPGFSFFSNLYEFSPDKRWQMIIVVARCSFLATRSLNVTAAHGRPGEVHFASATPCDRIKFFRDGEFIRESERAARLARFCLLVVRWDTDGGRQTADNREREPEGETVGKGEPVERAN